MLLLVPMGFFSEWIQEVVGLESRGQRMGLEKVLFWIQDATSTVMGT